MLNFCKATMLSSMALRGFISPRMITPDTTNRTTSAAAAIYSMICFSLSDVAKISAELSETMKSQPRFAI